MGDEGKSSFLKRVSDIQHELKCNKSQYNAFGKYSYRSCEDILEAAKPICRKYETVLFLTDEIKNIGDRYYVEATATLADINTEERITVKASAREQATKKGMDESQITGSSSSYARKYALNGLFNIDDTKDADTDEYTKAATAKAEQNATKYRCEECGKAFEACKDSRGNTYTAREIYEINKKRSPDGIARCKDCREKMTN